MLLLKNWVLPGNKSKILYCLCLCFLTVEAQKIGYVNVDVLLWYTPGYIEINDSLIWKQEEMQEKLRVKQNYGKTLLEQYYLHEKNLNKEQRNRMEKQISDLKAEIDEHVALSERKLEVYRQKLVQPFYHRIDSVASVIAKEFEYTYILNHANLGQTSNILIGPETGNLIPLFAQKLNLILPEDYIEIYREGVKQSDFTFLSR